MSPTETAILFLASASAVVVAGVALARSGDVIAARTRLGGIWVGSIFLALATSLPELTTDIAAIRLGAPDLAAGDIFGSSMANMLILAIVALTPGAELFRRAALDHVLSASLAIILTAIAAISVLIALPATWLGIGAGPLLLLLAYLAGTRTLYRHSQVLQAAGTTPEIAAGAAAAAGGPGELPSLRRAIVGFGLAALVILVAAPALATSAERIAELTGIGSSFIGTVLVGLATSLPELATSLAAVRIAAYDLAIGNLFGSNAVNMALFAPLDLAGGATPLFAVISEVHAITALVAIILMGIALGAVVYRTRLPGARLESVSFIMLLVYVAGLFFVYFGDRAP